jgi:hypothetical protein
MYELSLFVFALGLGCGGALERVVTDWSKRWFSQVGEEIDWCDLPDSVRDALVDMSD